MNRFKSIAGAITLSPLLFGCANNSILFVTKTSLSILEADTKPAGISVAYDRVEGYLGPTAESGEAPPVLGYFGSNGDIFTPKVKQVYATGNAARIITEMAEECTPAKIDKPDRVMFFGTSTTSGLKIGFIPSAPVPDSFVFGWRRKEFSLIPLSVATEDFECGDKKGKKGAKFYPATLASVNSLREVPPASPGGTKLTDQQYFATGDAAIGLAKMREIKGMIRSLSSDVFESYYEADKAQKAEAVVLAGCYAGLLPTDRPKVWDEASRFGLFQDDPGDEPAGAKLKKLYGDAVDAQGKVTAADKLAQADRIYVKALVTAPGGSDPARARLLAIHKKTVCDFSALNK